MELRDEIDKNLRRVIDYPKKGIVFYDITSLIYNPQLFSKCIVEMKSKLSGLKLDYIVAIESRGFLFASPLSIEMEIPLVLARKKNKLPMETAKKEYQLEYGTDEIHIQKVDLKKNAHYVIVDDLIATGGTLRATGDLIEENGGIVEAYLSLIALDFLPYKEILKEKVISLINYES